MLEQFMQLKGKAWYELTYSSIRFSRSWNRSGGNSVKLLSCNHLCWNLKKTWSVRKIYLVLLIQLFTALFYDHWRERKKREKKKSKCKNKYRRGGRKEECCCVMKTAFFGSCMIWCTTTTYYLWPYNTTQWVQCNRQKFHPAYYHIKHNKNLVKRLLFQNSMQCYKSKGAFLSSEILKPAMYFASEDKAFNVSYWFNQN